MLQTISTPRAAWWFSETYDTTVRGTPHSPPVTAQYNQSGFDVVSSRLTLPTSVERTFAQFLLGDAFVATLRAAPVMSIGALYDEHANQWLSRKDPIGLEIPIILRTSLRNESPLSPDVREPPPLDALHMPCMTPEFQSVPDHPDQTPPSWTAVIAVKVGFATFKLDYTVEWSEKDPKFPVATIAFPPQEKSDTKGEFTLKLKPVGGWQTTFRMPDLLPVASTGTIHYLVTGIGPGGESGELINRKLAFLWQYAPVAFTSDNVVTQPWAATPLPEKPVL